MYGPTNWTRPAPVLPTFYDRFDRTAISTNWTNVNGGGHWGIYNQELLYQDNKTDQQWFRHVSSTTPAANYTANLMKEMSEGSAARFLALYFLM